MKKNMSKNSYQKVLPIIMLVIILVTTSFMIMSCGNNDVKTADSESAQTTASVKETTKAKADKNKESDKAKETSEEPSKQEEKETEHKVSANQSKSSSKSSAKSSTKDKTSSTKATSKPTQAAKVCYISIEGYCSNKKIILQSEDTVYDILKRSGARVSASSTATGIYIEGINGRFEFDEGPTSGWVYYVNGSKPNKSCSKYTVGNGANIVWDYVTEY